MRDTQWAEFVSEYPIEAGTRETWDAWNDIPEEDRKKVLEGLQLWKRSEQWAKEGGKFIPYAKNFLVRELWRQKPPEMRKAKIHIPGNHGCPSYDSEAFERKARDPNTLIYKKRR